MNALGLLLTGIIFTLWVLFMAFPNIIGSYAGKVMNAYQAERMACDPDHWEY